MMEVTAIKLYQADIAENYKLHQGAKDAINEAELAKHAMFLKMRQAEFDFGADGFGGGVFWVGPCNTGWWARPAWGAWWWGGCVGGCRAGGGVTGTGWATKSFVLGSPAVLYKNKK